MRRYVFGAALAIASLLGCSGSETDEETDSTADALETARNRTGFAETAHLTGAIDRTNPFFLSMGTNGRTCESCHDARAAWTITPALAEKFFRETDGTHPLFRTNDGSNSPTADVSTVEARRAAYSMVLTKGVIRFTRTARTTWDFTVVSVDDPYGFSTPAVFSNFRRVPGVGNEAHQSSTTSTGGPHDVRTQLRALMNGATRGHAQATADVSPEAQAAGADFMMGLAFAQMYDIIFAGRLDALGARGGPYNLLTEPFVIGATNPNGRTFDIFDAWRDLPFSIRNLFREQIARGQEAFNTLEFDITGVPGLNDELGQPVIRGTCGTCHNAPNVGGSATFRVMNTGIANAARRTADTPLVTVRNNATGEELASTDLGRALSSGRFADIGKFRIPPLRGVGARPPYFHDGSARNLHEVLDFYEARFGIHFGRSRHDLIAFLEAL